MHVTRQSILEYAKPLRELDLAAPEGMWKRVALLQPRDRQLVELALRSNVSHRRIAELLNCTAGCVSRRLKRIGARLHDPVVLALLHPACPLEPSYRQIGVERLLSDYGVAELARKHERSTAEVRRIVMLIRMWYRGAGGRRGLAGEGRGTGGPKGLFETATSRAASASASHGGSTCASPRAPAASVAPAPSVASAPSVAPPPSVASATLTSVVASASASASTSTSRRRMPSASSSAARGNGERRDGF